MNTRNKTVTLHTSRGRIGTLAPIAAGVSRNAWAFLMLAVPLFFGSIALGQEADDIVKTDPQRAAQLESRLIKSTPFQVTLEGARAGEGYFSPDGKWLIFQSEQEPENPFYQIYLLNLSDGTTQRVSPGIGKTTCSWIDADGEHLLFASTHEDPQAVAKQRAELQKRAEGRQERYAWDYDENFDIYTVNRSQLGHDPVYVNLTKTRGYDAEGSYSPDGKLIAFASNRRAYNGEMSPEEAKIFANDPSYMMDIYLMNADGSDVRRLTDVPGYDGGPFFSPDGQRICWRRFSENGATAEIMTMNVDGSDQRQLTHMHAMSWAPYFHPSGKYLIFTTNRHGFGNFELYLVAADGSGEPIRVTYTDGFDGLPVFTPQGDQLYWTRQTSDSGPSGRAPAQIFRADWDHAAALAALHLDKERSTSSVSATENAVTPPETTADFSKDDVARHVAYLCRPELAGRMTGSPGERMATEYVAAYFDHLGLRPAGDHSWFQPFEFPAGAELGRNNELTAGGESESKLQLDSDWRPLSFSSSGEFPKAALVFAGYGIVVPASENVEAYDSYAHLDVKDKWVVVFRFMPERITPERRQQLAAFASLRDKARKARDLGARGLVVVSGPTSKVRDQLVPLQRDAALAGTSIAVVSVSDSVARNWFQAVDRDLNEVQTRLDGGSAQAGFELPGTLAANIDVQQVVQTGRNVVGRLVVGKEPSEEVIVVGAHIDHLGTGTSSSLARDDEKGQIHYGADDNASGVAVMMEIAEYLANLPADQRSRLKRDFVFAGWSGEELNLQGSKYFVSHWPSSATAKQTAISPTSDGTNRSGHSAAESIYPNVAAYINLDMVGRFSKSLILQGLGSSDFWKKQIQRLAIVTSLPVTTIDDTNLPTDATSFYLAGVPIIAAFTGSHNDYHTPRDTPEKLDYDHAAQIGKFLGLMAMALSESESPPQYLEHKSEAVPMARSGMRAYLGTIPDYAAEVAGVKISGASGGSPADKAGLKADDVIVELAGKKIENIYDYVAALEALKIGEPAKIVVQRGGQLIELQIVPASRQ